MKRKLQIFVSSTYKDLRLERQACVETILRAGHIPAGMELFSAGNEEQWQVIKRWIDECDVYMLLLGGRYGSIEPKSGMAYTELEYRYAQELGKPMFALVINDEYLNQKVRDCGRDMLELENVAKYRAFKEYVLSKISKFFSNENDIRLIILESLIDIERRHKLTGWVKAGALGMIDGNAGSDVSQDIKDAVTGDWMGQYQQMLDGTLRDIEISMTFKAVDNGRVVGTAKVEYGKEVFSVNMKGEFHLGRFIKLEYENANKAFVQFGLFVFKLSDRPDKLVGAFVGHGHVSEKVICGTVAVSKV